MSVEVVEGPSGLYVIKGDPTVGYEVHRVGSSIATYERKFLARRAVRRGEIEAAGP